MTLGKGAASRMLIAIKSACRLRSRAYHAHFWVRGWDAAVHIILPAHCQCIVPQAEANMHDEMFGHLLAAMRFGADEATCLAAIRVAFE